MDLNQYVADHTERGECRCGQCCDRGDAPDPTGHTADLIFFPVSRRLQPTREEFERLTREHCGEFGDCDPLDGREHSYLELGGWLGDQGAALRYMGLGALLGVFRLMTPRTMLGGDTDEGVAMAMAQAGLVAVQKAD